MSDDKKKTARRANDDYQTPIGVVSPLLALIDWPRVRSFCEPARGESKVTCCQDCPCAAPLTCKPAGGDTHSCQAGLK